MGQIPGEYTKEVSEKGKASGKQVVVEPPGAINHCVLVPSPATFGVSQQSAGGVNVVVSARYLVGTEVIVGWTL